MSETNKGVNPTEETSLRSINVWLSELRLVALAVADTVSFGVLTLPPGEPGVSTSPAYTGTLSADARIDTAQINFAVVMVFAPLGLLQLKRAVVHEDGSPSAGALSRRMIAITQPSCKIPCIFLRKGDLTWI